MILWTRCLAALSRLASPLTCATALALFALPAQAYVPSVRIGTAALIAPSAADSYYGSGTTSTNGLGASSRPPEIVALARALKNDPDLIYQYVHNNIEVVWEYGLQKGALGASIDKSGTPFDQAMLMVEILRQAGYSATYEAGTITLTGSQFTAWTNIADATAACQLLSSGGIPAQVNGSTTANCAYGTGTAISSVTLAHVWVKVTISGTAYVFDPSYKPYTWKAGLNLSSVTGLSSGTPLSQATSGMDTGTSSGLSYVHNLNQGALNTQIQTYAGNLLSYLRSNGMSGAQMEDVVGGGVITPTTTSLRQTSLPYTSAVSHEWTGGIPDQYRTTLYVKGETWLFPPTSLATMFAHTFYVDEIYGRRLTVDTNFDAAHSAAYNAYNTYTTTLLLDGQVIDTPFTTGGSPNQHQPVALTITANHPYAAAANGSSSTTGDYMDATISKGANLANPLSIVSGWGDTGAELLAKWSSERVEDKADPGRLDSPSCPDGPCNPLPHYAVSSGDYSREKAQAAFLAQYTRAGRLHAAIANGILQTHHVIGVIYGEDYVDDDNQNRIDGSQPDYWVADSTTRVDVDTGLSFTSRVADATRRRAAIQAIAATQAALEGSVIGQMSELPDISSTATRFEWGNAPTAIDLNGGDPLDSGDPSTSSGASAGPRKFFAVPSSTTLPSSGWAVWENDTSYSGANTTAQGTPSADAPNWKSALVSEINSYTASGFVVTASNESFLGPGQRGGYVKVVTDPHSHIKSYFPTDTKQRGGAFVATRYDTNGLDPLEIAHDVVGMLYSDALGNMRPTKGGGGGVQPNIAATYGPPDAGDILKSHFVDRSNALGINLANGSLSYQSPASLEVGTGGFPFSLSAGYSWHPGTGPSDFGPPVPTPTGWVSNWYSSLSISGSGMEGMGVSDVRAAVGTIAAFLAEQDIYTASPSTARDVAAVLTQAWLTHQYSGNVVTVNVGGSARQFVRLADSTWIAPGASYATLRVSGTRGPFSIKCGIAQGGPRYALSRGWDNSGLSFTVTSAQGDQQHFGYWLWHNVGDDDPNGFCDRTTGFRLNSWSFPNGVNIALTYATDTMVKDGTSRSTSPNAGTLFPSSTTLASVSNSLGRSLNFGWNEAIGQPTVTDGTRTLTGPQQFAGTTTTDPASATTNFTFTTLARSATQRPIAWSLLSQVYTADNLSLPNVQYDYDGTGQIYQVHDAIELQLGGHGPWQFYVASGTRGERDDPLGDSYSVVFDTYGHPARHINEDGNVTFASFDGRGRVVNYTYPEGDQEVYTYDERNNQLSLTRKAKPGSGLADLVLSVAYNEGATVATCTNIFTCNKPATQTNARGYVTNFGWDSLTGLLTQVLKPADADGTRPQTDYSYTSFGGAGFKLLTAKTEKIDASHSIVTSFAYNTSNDYVPQSASTDPSGLNLTSTYTFDAIGNPIEVDGPRSDVADVTDFTWDADRRQIFGIQADPDGAGPHPRPTIKNTYDAVGRVIQVDTGTSTSSTGGGFVSSLAVVSTYDPMGNKTREATPTRVTEYSFNSANRLKCTAIRMNPSTFGTPLDGCSLSTTGSYGPDRITRLAYDPAGQVLQEFRAWGTAQQITYATNTWTPNGKLASVYDADGATHVTHYTYDGFDRLTTTAFADSTTDQVTSYDAAGNVLTRLNRSGQSFTMTYDALDRVLTKVVPAAGSIPANTVTTGYDLLGHATTISDTNGNSLSNVFDLAGRQSSATRATPLLSSKTVSYQYDPAGDRTRLTWADGYYANYNYDALGHPTTVVDSDGTTLATYLYDDLARRASLQYNGASGAKMLYSWSSETDLLTLSSDFSGTSNDVSYTNTFTPAHQWATSTIDNAAFRFTPLSSFTHANGFNALNEVVSQYGFAQAWDSRGNYLGSASAPGGIYDSENRFLGWSSFLSMAIDPVGRRTAKNAFGTQTNFLHDGEMEIADYDGSGNLLRRYVPGPSIDDHIAMVTAAGAKTFFHTDKVGSVIAMSDTSGNMVEGPYVYDAFGLCSSNGGLCNTGVPFRYAGQRIDSELNCYYYRAREYCPSTGTFLQTDPIGYKDDLNLYTYVGNDPTDKTDPSGEYANCGGQASHIDTASGSVCGGTADGPNVAVLGMLVAANNAPPTGSRATVPYQRPSNATTPAQRAAVQGKPCAICGGSSKPMYAGHTRDLVREHHEEGSIDRTRMRSVDAVQPECQCCSCRGGAAASRYSKQMNATLPSTAKPPAPQGLFGRFLNLMKQGLDVQGRALTISPQANGALEGEEEESEGEP